MWKNIAQTRGERGRGNRRLLLRRHPLNVYLPSKHENCCFLNTPVLLSKRPLSGARRQSPARPTGQEMMVHALSSVRTISSSPFQSQQDHNVKRLFCSYRRSISESNNLESACIFERRETIEKCEKKGRPLSFEAPKLFILHLFLLLSRIEKRLHRYAL